MRDIASLSAVSPDRPAPPARPWRSTGLAILLLLGGTVLTYWPALHGDFIWDDPEHIANNLALRSPRGLWEIWFKPGATCQYYPLTFTGFWVGYQLWGLNPLGYHLLNVLLHGTVAVLLWQVLARLNVRGAWLAGALFALHPVNVMTGAWMTELKNTLSATMILAAAWAYLKFAGLGIYDRPGPPDQPGSPDRTRTGTAGGWWLYALALVLFQLGLFAKTAVSFLPVSLLLVTWWQRDRLRWRDVWPVLPMLGFVAVIGRVTVQVERLYGALGEEFQLSLAERVLVSGRSFWFYLGKLAWPGRLAFIYERWQVNPAAAWQYAYPVAAAALLAVLWWQRQRIGKGWFAALAHFYVCTSLLILLTVIYMTRYTFVSDHWQYFGAMGVMALAGSGISTALDWVSGRARRPWLKPAVCGLALLGLAMLSARQSRMYAGMETLWRTTIAASPRAFLAHNNLGELLAQRDELDSAEASFRRALEIQPRFAEAHYNLGNVLIRTGRANDAIREFRAALDSQPDFAEAHNNLGNVLFETGRLDEALAALQKALQFQPDFAEAHYNIGRVLAARGRPADAVESLTVALALKPDWTEAHRDLGNALVQSGRFSEAIGPLEKALASQPQSAESHNNLGWALLQAGRGDDAIAAFQKTLELQPDLVVTRVNLAMALLRQNQAEQAATQYQLALERQPDDFGIAATLAWLRSTWPDRSIRDGRLALDLALRANTISGQRDPQIVRVLAAAYAENGRYSDAVTAAQKALQLATDLRNSRLMERLRADIESYQAGAPVRDTNSVLNGWPEGASP